jgi:hypothetical protein
MGRSPSGGLVKLLDVDYPSEAGDPDHFEIQLAIPPFFFIPRWRMALGGNVSALDLSFERGYPIIIVKIHN